MGFQTSLTDFGIDCPVGCWSAGKTPDIIYVSWIDVKAGDDWTGIASFPSPAFIPLEQNTSTQWIRIIHPWRFVLDFNAGYTQLHIWHLTLGDVFFAKPLTSCTWQFESEIITPVDNVWWSGKAQLGWCPDTGTASVQKIMGLLNMIPDDDTWSQFWISDTDRMIALLAGKPGDTNILISFDYAL